MIYSQENIIEINNIHYGNCMELMKEIPDKSVDCIICDLPYEVLNKSNVNAQWDRIIPCEPLWLQYERVIKDKKETIARGMANIKTKILVMATL